MAGEMTERQVRNAARAAARQAHLYARVLDDFAVPAREESILTLEDAMKELDERGHIFDENCDSPFCIKAAQMLARRVKTGAVPGAGRARAAPRAAGEGFAEEYTRLGAPGVAGVVAHNFAEAVLRNGDTAHLVSGSMFVPKGGLATLKRTACPSKVTP